MNVAIISPNQNTYSETFIQAHKKIDANVFYYFGGAIPNQLEGFGCIDQCRWISLIKKNWTKDYGEKGR